MTNRKSLMNMVRRVTLSLGSLVIGWACLPVIAAAADAAKPQTPGLGDPGQLVEVQIESGRTVDGAFALDGQDARSQLVVTGKYSSGQLRDSDLVGHL